MTNIITENELNDIVSSLEKEKELNKLNLNVYDLFIQKKKNEEVNKINVTNVTFEKHHIIPKFDGGLDEPDNLVLLTIKEHIIAHWLRWKVLGKQGDYRAYVFRVGDTDTIVAERLQLVKEARERDKLEKKGFFNSNFQQEMGTRGGFKGGASNTLKQAAARQQVGKTYGRLTGIKNQSLELKEFISNCSIWEFNPAKSKLINTVNESNLEIFCLVTEKSSFKEVALTLNTFIPNSIAIEKVATMHKLVKGERSQMYGWRIVDMLIRSEVREGILNFRNKNPKQILMFEKTNSFAPPPGEESF